MSTNWLNSAINHARRNGPFPHQLSIILDNPLRRLWVNPTDVVDSLTLTGSENVLELGPGPGFFSVEIAHRLATGRLELLDMQPEMLEKARRKLGGAGCHNVGFHTLEASDEYPFPDSSFDVAFLAAVLGEVPDKSACIRSLARVLKPGGLLVFLEMFPDPDRLRVHTLRDLAEAGDFAFLDAEESFWRDIVRFKRLERP
jgi:ubiquinone/menaquinone biosynthesis C-methylase UbiE